MKKDTKLLILVGVLLAFIIAYNVIGHIGTKQNNSSNGTALFSIESENIARLEWTYEGESYAIENKTGVWHWTEDENFPVNQYVANDMANRFAALSASQEISGENLAEYGFDDESRVIAATDKDGNEYKVTIGGRIDITSENYVTTNQSKSIYTVGVSFSSVFNKTIDKLLKKETIMPIEKYSKIRVVEGDNVFEAEKNNEGKWMSGDVELDEGKISAFANSYFEFMWTDCDTYNADEAKKTERGFDNPTGEVAISSDNDELRIIFGKAENGVLYAKLGGSNMIYTVSPEVRQYLDVSPDDFKPNKKDETETKE